MDYFPFYVNLKDNTVLIVGGGETALRKAKLLIKADANIKVVAPEICTELKELAEASKVSLDYRCFVEEDLTNCFAVIVATDKRDLNQAISETCHQRQLLVNVVDQPEDCSFIFPSIIDRSPLVVALSSGGKAPVLLRFLRTKLESLIPEKFGDLAAFAGRMRDYVKERFASVDDRRRFWEKVFSHPLTEFVYQGDEAKAESTLRELCEQQGPSQGQVFLVGAGPGDPDLLTFRALRLMQQADVVLYDRLVSKPILELVRRDAELVNVGKRVKNHTLPQNQINELLIHYASQGKTVVRLKGGDPFIFGRGGEEIEQVVAAGYATQVVPGITSAAAAACYCGIPLTHRDYAQSVLFATGHLKDQEMDLNWQNMARERQTLVIYMGLLNLEKICQSLIKQGVSAGQPVAIISNATRPNQRVIIGRLDNIVDIAIKSEAESPAIIIIGEVVKLYENLRLNAKVVDA